MFQQTTVVGRLGRDAEKKQFNGQDCCQLSVAVDNGYYDNAGHWIDRTNWYRCSIWRDVKTDRLKKGAVVMVQGTLTAQLYKGSDGQQRISLDIKTDHFRVLVKSQDDQQPSEPQAAGSPEQPAPAPVDGGDDLPF
jgi:single-strand DNA-binding protein